MYKSRKIVDILKSNNFLDFLKTNFKDGFLYSEAEMQCLTYMYLRNNISKWEYIYSEVNAWRYRADLAIFYSSLKNIRQDDTPIQHSKSFNISNYSKYCNTWIELKYCIDKKYLFEELRYENIALTNNWKQQTWQKDINRISISILDITIPLKEGKNKDILVFSNEEIQEIKNIFWEDIFYICFTWDWVELKTIKNF